MNLVTVQHLFVSLLVVKRLGLLLLLLVLPAYAQEASVTGEVEPAVAAEQPAVVATVSATTDSQVVPASEQTKVHSVSKSVTPANLQTHNQSAQTNVAPIGSGRHLLNVTLALLGIIGLIFAISWFVKRFSQGTFSANSHIKVISAMPLGTRERIVLIDAGGQQLLLGITSTNINTLHVFETPIALDTKADSQSDFSRKLMAILQQKTPPSSAADHNNNNSAP